MKRFEYFDFTVFMNDNNWSIYYNGREYDYSKHYQRIMNELGKNGWELVSVVSLVGSEKPWFLELSMTYTNAMQYHFKRDNTNEVIEELNKIQPGSFEEAVTDTDLLILYFEKQDYAIKFQHSERIIFTKDMTDIRFDYDYDSGKWIEKK